MDYARIAARLFDQPHMIHPDKAAAVLRVLAPRLGIGRIRTPGGEWIAPAAMPIDKAQAVERPRRDRGKTFHTTGGVAVIPIDGTLVNKLGSLDPFSGMTGYDGIMVKVQDAMADPQVKGIFLDIESHGGEVAGLFDVTRLIFQSNASNGGKPVWAVAADMAFSAAYVLAAAADMVFLPPTGLVGSIGVITIHEDISQRLEDEGIAVTMIFAGAHKVDGNPFEPLPDSVHADFQARINENYTILVDAIGLLRKPMTAESARATEAQIYMGDAAVEAGLADGVAMPSVVLETMVTEVNARPLQRAV